MVLGFCNRPARTSRAICCVCVCADCRGCLEVATSLAVSSHHNNVPQSSQTHIATQEKTQGRHVKEIDKHHCGQLFLDLTNMDMNQSFVVFPSTIRKTTKTDLERDTTRFDLFFNSPHSQVQIHRQPHHRWRYNPSAAAVLPVQDRW